MDRPLFRLLKTWVQTKSPSLTTLKGLIWISSPGWLLTYLQQLSQSYALSLAPRCLLANELWRCLVITAAVSPFLSPPFYHLLNWRKIIDWNPLDIVWTLLSVISLVLVLFLAFGACSLMPTCPPPHWFLANGFLIKLLPKMQCIFLKLGPCYAYWQEMREVKRMAKLRPYSLSHSS